MTTESKEVQIVSTKEEAMFASLASIVSDFETMRESNSELLDARKVRAAEFAEAVGNLDVILDTIEADIKRSKRLGIDNPALKAGAKEIMVAKAAMIKSDLYKVGLGEAKKLQAAKVAAVEAEATRKIAVVKRVERAEADTMATRAKWDEMNEHGVPATRKGHSPMTLVEACSRASDTSGLTTGIAKRKAFNAGIDKVLAAQGVNPKYLPTACREEAIAAIKAARRAYYNKKNGIDEAVEVQNEFLAEADKMLRADSNGEVTIADYIAGKITPEDLELVIRRNTKEDEVELAIPAAKFEEAELLEQFTSGATS